jgi:hypothetical protein
MSTVTYRHERNERKMVNGVNQLIKEQIIDGEKGLSFSLLTKNDHKDGKSEFYRISAMETEKDSFAVKEKVNDKETEKTMTMDEVKKMLKSNKDLNLLYLILHQEKKRNQKVRKVEQRKLQRNLQKRRLLKEGFKESFKEGF